jgi:hypothetical protein
MPQPQLKETGGIANIAPLSKIITIDVPFVLGELVLPEGAFVEGIYKAARDPIRGFKKNLRDETKEARYAGITEAISTKLEKELALENAYADRIFERPILAGVPTRTGLSDSYYHAGVDGGYDDGISSLLLGYTTQATGNPNLEIGKLKDEVGPLLPNSVERGAQLFKAGRDAGTAIHEYLTEQRILNQRMFRRLSD